jgi:hypothetical protein
MLYLRLYIRHVYEFNTHSVYMSFNNHLAAKLIKKASPQSEAPVIDILVPKLVRRRLLIANQVLADY